MTRQDKDYKLVDFDKWEVGCEYECVVEGATHSRGIGKGDRIKVTGVDTNGSFADIKWVGTKLYEWALHVEDMDYFKKIVRDEKETPLPKVNHLHDVHSVDIIINFMNGTTISKAQVKEFDKNLEDIITPVIIDHKVKLKEGKHRQDMIKKVAAYSNEDLVELLISKGVEL